MTMPFPHRGALRLALLVGLCLGGGSLAPAQDKGDKPTASPAAAETPAQPWTVNCTSAGAQAEMVCTLSQFLVVKDSGQRVLTAVVMKRDGKVLLNLGLPHGLNLPKGVTVWIDEGAKATYPILTADQKGSYATVPLEAPFVEAMKKGTTLHVAVSAFTGNELVLQLSLAGFTAAFAKI